MGKKWSGINHTQGCRSAENSRREVAEEFKKVQNHYWPNDDVTIQEWSDDDAQYAKEHGKFRR